MGKRKRKAERFQVALPLTVRFLRGKKKGREKKGQTRDVSLHGFYFFIDADVRIDTPIEFLLTLPKGISGALRDVQVRGRGQVVRVERQNGSGVAVRVESYEFVFPE